MKEYEVRTEPVSLNESTLEANITAEIKAIFDSSLNSVYPDRLYWIFDIPKKPLTGLKRKKVRIHRLTPIEENRGGGWDSKVVIPKEDGSQRAIFIQFKAGKRREGNSEEKSIFNLTKKDPNPYAEFSINNNTGNNQHKTLQNLIHNLSEQGLSEKAVLYGFPRITSRTDFDNLEDDLLLYTTFLTVKELDDEAKKSEVNLSDGNQHHFRTCYLNELYREVASNPFPINDNSDSENLLFEILAVKLSYKRNTFINYVPLELLDEWLFLQLGDYLGVNPIKLHEFNIYPYKELSDYFDRRISKRRENEKIVFGDLPENDLLIKSREKIFTKIKKIFIDSRESKIDINNQISSIHTIVLPKEKDIEFTISGRTDCALLIF